MGVLCVFLSWRVWIVTRARVACADGARLAGAAKIIAVADLPRTLSGKLSELAVRNIIHGRAVENSAALANPEALEYFRDLAELRS